MRKAINVCVFLMLTYSLVLFLGLIYLFLRLIGRIRVTGLQHLGDGGRGTLMVSNHLSIFDGLPLLPMLYFPKLLFHPFKFFPWSTPDRSNFIDPWYFRWWLPYLRAIPIDRTSFGQKRNEAAINTLIDRLALKEIVIVFPEGGRTSKQPVLRYSPLKHKAMAPFKPSFEKILQTADCDTVPVWLEGTDKVLPIGSVVPRFWRSKIFIRIGEPIREKLTSVELENKLFELADA